MGFTTAHYIRIMTLFRLFRHQGDSLAVSMAGLKMGDRLLVLGCAEPRLVAALAIKTGLTGRALAVDARPALIEAAAALAPREGALIETAVAPWTALPVENAGFDVAVVHDVFGAMPPGDRAACAVEVHRALRPGGRCLVIDRAKSTGLAALAGRGALPAEYQAAGGACGVLRSAPFRAVRLLASRDGLDFAEAARANEP